METHEDGTYFQVGDHVSIKITRETGTINAADGGVVSVILDGTNESKFFTAYVDDDAYIELVTVKDEASILQRENMRSQGA
jgi:hypothetical protein